MPSRLHSTHHIVFLNVGNFEHHIMDALHWSSYIFKIPTLFDHWGWFLELVFGPFVFKAFGVNFSLISLISIIFCIGLFPAIFLNSTRADPEKL